MSKQKKTMLFRSTLTAALAGTLALASAAPAHAILNYYIYESGPNVVAETQGSLTGLVPAGFLFCGAAGAIVSSDAILCTGPDNLSNLYIVSGPTTFNGSVTIYPADSVTGIATTLVGDSSFFLIDLAYVPGTPIVSSATFNNKTLSGLGFTTTGLIGTWTLNSAGDTINVYLSAPPSPGTGVPAPLPLLGAGAAFAHSRLLRRRINRRPAAPASAASLI